MGLQALADGDPNWGCDATQAAGPLLLKQCDYSFAKQGDKVLILWDVTPYREQLKGKDADATAKVAAALVQGPALAKYPKVKEFKVAVAEVPERDNYGLPNWSSLKIVERFVFKADKKGKLVQQTQK
jgi:hypothetical protein